MKALMGYSRKKKREGRGNGNSEEITSGNSRGN